MSQGPEISWEISSKGAGVGKLTRVYDQCIGKLWIRFRTNLPVKTIQTQTKFSKTKAFVDKIQFKLYIYTYFVGENLPQY